MCVRYVPVISWLCRGGLEGRLELGCHGGSWFNVIDGADDGVDRSCEGGEVETEHKILGS